MKNFIAIIQAIWGTADARKVTHFLLRTGYTNMALALAIFYLGYPAGFLIFVFSLEFFLITIFTCLQILRHSRNKKRKIKRDISIALLVASSLLSLATYVAVPAIIEISQGNIANIIGFFLIPTLTMFTVNYFIISSDHFTSRHYDTYVKSQDASSDDVKAVKFFIYFGLAIIFISAPSLVEIAGLYIIFKAIFDVSMEYYFGIPEMKTKAVITN